MFFLNGSADTITMEAGTEVFVASGHRCRTLLGLRQCAMVDSGKLKKPASAPSMNVACPQPSHRIHVDRHHTAGCKRNEEKGIH